MKLMSGETEVPHSECTIVADGQPCPFCGRELADYAWSLRDDKHAPYMHELCFRIKYQGFDPRVMT